MSSWTNSKTGEVNPFWKLHIKLGVQAGTPFNAVRSYASPSFIFYSRDYTSLGQAQTGYRHRQWEGTLIIPPPTSGAGFPSSPEADANSEALRRFVQKVRKQQTTFQGGVFLGELGEAIHMLRHPGQALFEGIGGYLSTLKKAKKRTPPKHRRRVLAETYLEYSFGWAPFISDIESAKEAIAKLPEKPERKRIHAQESRTVNSSYTGIFSIPSSTDVPFLGSLSGYLQTNTDVIYLGSVAAEAFASSYALKQVGLDLSNFVPTAWELIPWSFLVDYFTNIGNIISAASLSSASLNWILKTVRTSRHYIPTAFNPTFGVQSDSQSFESGRHFTPGSSSLVNVVRDPYLGSLVPSLEFHLPFSGLQWLNIAALGRAHRGLMPFY
jgi:hypothetical protein